MISPQNLTIAATAVGPARPGVRHPAPGALTWSIGLLLFMCILVYLQSNVLALDAALTCLNPRLGRRAGGSPSEPENVAQRVRAATGNVTTLTAAAILS